MFTIKFQQYFEETYGGSMRELELLVMNFDLDADTHRLRSSRTADTDEEKPLSPNVILDMIKHTLRIYKQQLEQTTAEVGETYILLYTLLSPNPTTLQPNCFVISTRLVLSSGWKRFTQSFVLNRLLSVI